MDSTKRTSPRRRSDPNPKKRKRPLITTEVDLNRPEPSSSSNSDSSASQYQYHSILRVQRSPYQESYSYDGDSDSYPHAAAATITTAAAKVHKSKQTTRTISKRDKSPVPARVTSPGTAPTTPSTTAPAATPPSRCNDGNNCNVLERGCMFDNEFSAVGIKNNGIVLSGSVWMSVIKGRVEVLGASLTSASDPALIVSAPIAPFLIRISPQHEPKNNRCGAESKEIDSTDPRAAIHKKISASLKNVTRNSKYSAVVLFTSIENQQDWQNESLQTSSDISVTIKEYASQAGVPSTSTGANLVGGMSVLKETGKTPVFQEWHKWKTVTASIDSFLSSVTNWSTFRLLVCGYSGAGKSTFVRCISNHLLSHRQRIVLIDTDVGQPEMNPPGLISAHLITHFRLGAAAASNRMVPIAARYFGDVTAREDPDLYAQFISEVTEAAMKFANEHNCPIIINCSGWLAGVGADLLRFLQNCANPSHVAILQFPNSAPNLFLREICSRVPEQHVYDLICPYPTRSTVFSSNALRDLHIASYFSKELMLGRVYNVSAEDVSIVTVGDGLKEENIYAALNATLVALAAEQKNKDGETSWAVRGLGIVRAVDAEKKMFFVSTPIPPNVLEGCTGMLISGGIQIPRALFLTVAADRISRSEDAPYICRGCIAIGEPMRSRATLIRR